MWTSTAKGKPPWLLDDPTQSYGEHPWPQGETRSPREGWVSKALRKHLWGPEWASWAQGLTRSTKCHGEPTRQGWCYRAHCKDTKIQNKYSQKRKCAAPVLISTFMCLWAICIFPRSACLFFCRKIWGLILGLYKYSQAHERGNWHWGRAIPFLGIHKYTFGCSVWGRACKASMWALTAPGRASTAPRWDPRSRISYTRPRMCYTTF